MGQIKLEKTKERKFKMNNWVKFFLADALISTGTTCGNYGLIFPAVFGILGGVGTILALIASLMEE